MVSRPARAAVLAALAVAAGCAQSTETHVARTATEQLLIARAADRAAEKLVLPTPRSARIYVDDTYFKADGAAYAISAIRAALSRAGHPLAQVPEQADAVLELRAGALSLEQMRRIVGLPAMSVPVTEQLNVVSLPELSIYSRRDRVGVAEFSGFLYDSDTGEPLGAITPMIGEHRIRSHKLLMILNWGHQAAQPGEADPGDSWREW